MILTDLADAMDVFSLRESSFWPMLSYSDSNVF